MNEQKGARKKALVRLIVTTLRQELDVLLDAAKAAHEAATHEESRAEDQHDTRGLEASYLAGAQMARAENLKRVILGYQFTEIRTYAADEPIGVGALIKLEHSGVAQRYFLVNTGGGMTVTLEGDRVQVITTQSPLGEELLGKRAGDAVEIANQRVTREYEIVSVE